MKECSPGVACRWVELTGNLIEKKAEVFLQTPDCLEPPEGAAVDASFSPRKLPVSSVLPLKGAVVAVSRISAHCLKLWPI